MVVFSLNLNKCNFGKCTKTNEFMPFFHLTEISRASERDPFAENDDDEIMIYQVNTVYIRIFDYKVGFIRIYMSILGLLRLSMRVMHIQPSPIGMSVSNVIRVHHRPHNPLGESTQIQVLFVRLHLGIISKKLSNRIHELKLQKFS